jgi:hypothetical protein
LTTDWEFTIHHVKSAKPYVYITLPKKDANVVELGRMHSISIDSVKERTDYNVFENVDGPAVKISRLLMSLQGFGPDHYPRGHLLNLELGWMNITKQGEPAIRYFLAYRIGSRVNIRVMKCGADGGDLLRLRYIKPYEPSDFVKDFESLKKEHSNVTLLCQEEVLALWVDSERFELKSPRISFFGRLVTLSAIVVPTMKEVRFRFNLDDKIRGIRFFKDKRVSGMRANPRALEICYRSGTDGDRVFSVYRDKLDKSRVLGDMRLLSFPETGVGSFWSTISPAAAQYVRSRLASSARTSRWSREEGDISEEIQANLLQVSEKWIEIARHPFSTGERAYDSSRFGPDSLMRWRPSGELCYFEFKWWGPSVGKRSPMQGGKRRQTSATIRHIMIRG